ncbi:substrate-binding domain-containing protein [Paenibacillus sp. N1-5-1-14]|uniref:substrate-binding domain-containing protein n=1 Tax=Paenibacillus radicibacter TaxID=2972488 RepID=UPI0021591421|nr:substrate-binding domain-containing protein [Paenibacillus radicibacter]MCR8644016.1 substrate-binding domain-containing protein [Paenibacillus radicibacter]
MDNKRIGLLFMLLCIVLSISSCSDQTVEQSANQRKEVTFVAKLKQGDYWNTIRMGAEAAAKEFGANLNFIAPDLEEDTNRLHNMALQAIRSSVDAVVVAASDESSLQEITEQAGKQHITVITVDSEVESDTVKSVIGTNNYEAGKKAGMKLVELVGTSGKIAMMSFVEESHQADLREQGFLDALKLYPDVKVLETGYCQSDVKIAKQLTQQWLAKHGQVDGIVALNAAASVGVAEAIKQSGLAGKVKIVAFDNTPAELEFLQDGVLQATIVQNPFSIGYLGVKYAIEATRGMHVPKRVDTGFKVIDLANMFWSENQKLLFPFVK